MIEVIRHYYRKIRDKAVRFLAGDDTIVVNAHFRHGDGLIVEDGHAFVADSFFEGYVEEDFNDPA